MNYRRKKYTNNTPTPQPICGLPQNPYIPKTIVTLSPASLSLSPRFGLLPSNPSLSFFSPTPLGQSSSSAIHLHLIQNCFKLEHFYSLPIPSNSSVAKFPSTSSLYLSLTPTPHSLVRASPPHSVFCIAFPQFHFLPLTFPFNTIPFLSLFSFTYFSFSFFINNFSFNNNSFLLDFHFLFLFIYLRLSF